MIEEPPCKGDGDSHGMVPRSNVDPKRDMWMHRGVEGDVQRSEEGYLCLKILMGLFSMTPLGSTRADQMEIDSKETEGGSVRTFPALRAAWVGGELPVPGSMQVEAGESLGQDVTTSRERGLD